MSTKDFLNRNVSLPAGQIVQNEKFKFHVGKSVTNKRVEVQLSLRTPPPPPHPPYLRDADLWPLTALLRTTEGQRAGKHLDLQSALSSTEQKPAACPK